MCDISLVWKNSKIEKFLKISLKYNQLGIYYLAENMVK